MSAEEKETTDAKATAAVPEPNELNVRLLEDEHQFAARAAAKNLSQSIIDESSPYSRKRQVKIN